MLPRSPSGGPVRIEIRPAFDEAVRAAERPLRLAAAKLIVLLESLGLPGLRIHRGLHFEKLQGMIEPVTAEQLYSLRVTRQARAITCILSGPTLVLISLHPQHDKAYRAR
jgi:hypothetical protein